MEKIQAFLNEVFSHFEANEKLENERKRLSIFMEKKYNDYLQQGLDKDLAYEKLVLDFGAVAGLVATIEKKFKVQKIQNVVIPQTSKKKKPKENIKEITLEEAKTFVKRRLINSVLFFLAYLILGVGTTAFLIILNKKLNIILFNKTFETLIFGLSVLGISIFISAILILIGSLKIKKIHKLINTEKFELNETANTYITNLSNGYKNTYFISTMLCVVIAISSSLLLIGFEKLKLIILFFILACLFSIITILSSYKKSFDLLLNKYEYSTNATYVTNFIEQVSASVLPTLIIVNLIGIFAFDAVVEMMAGLGLTITGLFIFVVYYENIRKKKIK